MPFAKHPVAFPAYAVWVNEMVENVIAKIDAVIRFLAPMALRVLANINPSNECLDMTAAKKFFRF
jgi:hypothetical protein